MARSRMTIQKRREIRVLEAQRDSLMMKRDKTVNSLAQIKAALKKRRSQT